MKRSDYSVLIDFHVHAFPDYLGNWLGKIPGATVLSKVKRQVRSLTWPYSRSLHRTQTTLRLLPEPLRKPLDEIGAFAAAPGLLFESSLEDLKDAMRSVKMDKAVLVSR